MDIKAANSLDDLVVTSNFIVTTTSATDPLVLADQVQKGTHVTAITAMGSDDLGKQELEGALLVKADCVIADSIEQCVDHGECGAAARGKLIEVQSIIELGNSIKTPVAGRSSDDQITIAGLTGVAVQEF